MLVELIERGASALVLEPGAGPNAQEYSVRLRVGEVLVPVHGGVRLAHGAVAHLLNQAGFALGAGALPRPAVGALSVELTVAGQRRTERFRLNAVQVVGGLVVSLHRPGMVRAHLAELGVPEVERERIERGPALVDHHRHQVGAELHRAGVGLELADQHAQQRRLARAVGPDQPEHAAGFEIEVDAVGDDDAAEALAERAHDHELLGGEGAFEAVLFEEMAAELAKNVEKVLRRHRTQIGEMQYTQRRAADMAIDLYALAACLSRTTRAMAVDHAAQKIRVNAIAPSATLSDRVKKLIVGNTGLKALVDQHLFGLGQPIHIADMAVYLASDEAAIVTGQIFPVDSGVTAY